MGQDFVIVDSYFWDDFQRKCNWRGISFAFTKDSSEYHITEDLDVAQDILTEVHIEFKDTFGIRADSRSVYLDDFGWIHDIEIVEDNGKWVKDLPPQVLMLVKEKLHSVMDVMAAGVNGV
jgi:hypothetical protein